MKKNYLFFEPPIWCVMLLFLPIFAVGACLPSAGRAEIFGETGPQVKVDSSSQPSYQEQGVVPHYDSMGIRPESGTTPPVTTPQGPFGTTVGLTANDFSGIPDCSDQLYSLYSYFNVKKGVIIAMMSPS